MGFDSFLDLKGIPGESKDVIFANHIDLLSWSFGVQHVTISHGTDPAGKSKTSDMTFQHYVDQASPLIFKACALGSKIPKAVLHVRKAGGTQQEYLTITLEDVYVVSVETHGRIGGEKDIPVETFRLDFRKFTSDYKQQTEKGTTTGKVTYTHDFGEQG